MYFKNNILLNRIFVIVFVAFIVSCKRNKTKELIKPYVGKWMPISYISTSKYGGYCIDENTYIIDISEDGDVNTYSFYSQKIIFQGSIKVYKIGETTVWSLREKGINKLVRKSDFFVSDIRTEQYLPCVKNRNDFYATFTTNGQGDRNDDKVYFFGNNTNPNYRYIKL